MRSSQVNGFDRFCAHQRHRIAAKLKVRREVPWRLDVGDGVGTRVIPIDGPPEKGPPSRNASDQEW